MKTITITTKEGTTWSTEINGTWEEIEKYYLGKRFNVGPYTEENMELVVDIKLID